MHVAFEGRMVRNRSNGGILPGAPGAGAWRRWPPARRCAIPDWNLQPPVTPIARQMYDLHLFIFWICVVIFVAVFGVMFYSIFKHRKSRGPQGGAVPREHDGRDRLDGDPVPDPAVHGLPGDQDHPRDEGHVARRASRSRSPATSGAGTTTTCRKASASTRTSSTPLAQIENRAPKGEHYLLEVDNPLVVPVDTKVRVLITAGDVLHAWWVPAFGVKQDAIPGFVRDTWFKAEKIGVYRGQCAELCGKGHGFMPIVVEVKSKEDYAKWVAEQKAKAVAAGADPNKVWDAEGPRRRPASRSTRPIAPPATRRTARACPARSRRSTARRSSTGPKARQIDARAERQARAPRCRRGRGSPTPTSPRSSPTRATAWGNKTGEAVQPAEIKARPQVGPDRDRSGDFEMSTIAHDHAAGLRAHARRPRASPDRDHALAHDDQPQGHRHDVPVVLVHDVPGRRHDGDGDPRRALPAGAAGRRIPSSSTR